MDTPSVGLDTSPYVSWIGRSTTSTAFLDPAQANRMAATLDRDQCFEPGDRMPPGWHWLYFHDVVRGSRLGADGHPKLGETMPPVPLARRMWAGGSLHFDAPLRLGETARRVTTITGVASKSGRTGPLCFVTVEHRVTVEDHLCLSEQQTIVYRDAATASGPGATAPQGAEVTQAWDLDSRTLFRYSALTFNSHRIHYDADYARDVEGYPGLVVHGPLLATLLMDLCFQRGDRIAAFDYRAQSPVFAPESVLVSRRGDANGVKVWASSEKGRLAMDGHVTLRKETNQ